MERKQLDFDAPLLSVRRFSPKLVSADWDVVNVGTLPSRRSSMLSARPNFNLEQVTEPVAVPFMWEHIPGRAKSKSGPIPRAKPFDEPFRKETIDHQKLIRTVAQMSFSKKSSLTKLEPPPSDWETGGEDDAFSDALDTLSPATFSRNCSVSGLSGSGGLDAKPSGTFSTDPQTRDFMLRRFLPAAKAMTLEPPQYLSRKQQALTVSHELPRDVKKMAIDDTKLQVGKHDTRIIPYLEESKRCDESESEADDYDPPAVVPAKARGFLPRLRSSLCLLNPMPGMKFRSQSPKPSLKATPKAPFDEVRRPKKAFSGPLIHYTDKHTLNAINNNHRFDNGVKNNKQMPFRQSYSGELPRTNMSSPYRNSHSGAVSPYRNERPASPLRQAMKFIGIPKIVQNLKADRSSAYDKDQKSGYPQGAPSRPAEKTLYIDSINTVEYANFRPSYSETKGKVQQDESKAMNALKRSNIEKAKASGRARANGEAPSFSDVSHVESRGRTRRNSNVIAVNTNMNPPLPRCPSESWLWRTLPSVPSSRSTSPHARKVSQVTSTTCTKWENIVKTSYLHHDHMRYSQELVANSRKQTRT